MANPDHVKRLKESTIEEWNKWRKDNPDIIPDLSGADLSGADLREKNLRLVNLRYAHLRYAHLKGADLEGADLRGAYLMDAHLEGADLRYVDLRHADLRGAHLMDAHLMGAHLEGASLEGANLKGTILEKKGNKKNSDSDMASFERSFDSKLETYRRDFDKKIEKLSDLTPERQKELSSIFEQKVEKTLEGNLIEKVGKAVQEKTADYFLRQKSIEYIETGFSTAKVKQGEYADIAEKNAKIFQWIGIGLAALGVWIALSTLTHFVDGGPIPENSYEYLPFILPPIFLCEVLAFIMFSMSSKALEKMQSFSKEYSTLDIKSAAMKSLILHGDEDQIVDASRYLTEMERNYILKKDEKTIEGEANQHNIAFIKEYAQAINPMGGVKDEASKKIEKVKAKV